MLPNRRHFLPWADKMNSEKEAFFTQPTFLSGKMGE